MITVQFSTLDSFKLTISELIGMRSSIFVSEFLVLSMRKLKMDCKVVSREREKTNKQTKKQASKTKLTSSFVLNYSSTVLYFLSSLLLLYITRAKTTHDIAP